MENNKVLYIAQEISPYVADSHLSLITRALSQELQGNKLEARVFTPKYGCINERRNQLHEVIRLSGLNIPIDDNDHQLIIKVATLLPTRMQVYFIDCDDYFQNESSKRLETISRADENDERMMFFSIGVLETVKKSRWQPAVIQCSGWLTGLVPLLLKDLYKDEPMFASTKIVYALHNNDYFTDLDQRLEEKMKMMGVTPNKLKKIKGLSADWMKLNQLAIDYSDAIVQVDADVPQEIIDYAMATGKPMLKLEDENDISETAYLEFIQGM